MDLIEEYLKVVAALLPRGQRDDIVAELRDLILTRKEAREEELGRPLTDDEIEAVLREVGHPLVVAARYGEGPQHAVGPMLYPYWLFGVKAILVIEAVVAVVILVFGGIGYADPGAALGHALGVSITGAATLIGFLTVAAWLIERLGLRIDYLDNWRVKDLRAFIIVGDWNAFRDPQAPRANGRDRRPPPPPPRAPRRHAFAGHLPRHAPAARGVALIVWAAFLMMWWVGGLRILGPHGLADLRPAFDPQGLAAADWGALKAAVFWPVLAYVLALLAQGVVLVAWPRQLRLHGVMDIGAGFALAALVAWLWNAPVLASSVQVDSVAGFVARTVSTFAYGPPFPLPGVLTLALVCAAFGAAGRVIRGLFQAVLPGGWREDAPPFGGRAARP